MRPSEGSGLTSLFSHPAGSAGVQHCQVPALQVRQLPLPRVGRGLGHPHGSPLLPDDSCGHGGGHAPRRRDTVGGRRCWDPALLGSTPEMCRGDHEPLLSLYPPAVSASSLPCVSPSLLAAQGVQDGVSQGISSSVPSCNVRQPPSHPGSQGAALWASPSKTSLLRLALWGRTLSLAWGRHGCMGLCTLFAGTMTEQGRQLPQVGSLL